MKNPEIVKQAIAALRDNADSDFESAAIDSLENILNTGKLEVEVIDDNHQRFNGVIFGKDKDGHYIGCPRILHRVIYEYHNGKIPVGYVIHHRDFNPANNDIDNLQALTVSEHRAAHSFLRPKNCEYCGKVFAPRNITSRFCSRHCALKSRRKNPLQPRKCKYCSKEFHPRNDKQRFCCRDCADKSRRISKVKHCEYCNREFRYRRKTNRFCSRSCAIKAHYNNQQPTLF